MENMIISEEVMRRLNKMNLSPAFVSGVLFGNEYTYGHIRNVLVGKAKPSPELRVKLERAAQKLRDIETIIFN